MRLGIRVGMRAEGKERRKGAKHSPAEHSVEEGPPGRRGFGQCGGRYTTGSSVLSSEETREGLMVHKSFSATTSRCFFLACTHQTWWLWDSKLSQFVSSVLMLKGTHGSRLDVTGQV